MSRKTLKDLEYFQKLNDVDLTSVCVSEPSNNNAWGAFMMRFDKRAVRPAVKRACQKLMGSYDGELVGLLVQDVFVRLWCGKLKKYKSLPGKTVDGWLSVVSSRIVINFCVALNSGKERMLKYAHSVHETVNSESGLAFEESLLKSYELNPEEEMIGQELIDFLKEHFKERDLEIYKDYLKGFKPIEIISRRTLDISSKRVYHIIKEVNAMVMFYLFGSSIN